MHSHNRSGVEGHRLTLGNMLPMATHSLIYQYMLAYIRFY